MGHLLQRVALVKRDVSPVHHSLGHHVALDILYFPVYTNFCKDTNIVEGSIR